MAKGFGCKHTTAKRKRTKPELKNNNKKKTTAATVEAAAAAEAATKNYTNNEENPQLLQLKIPVCCFIPATASINYCLRKLF